VSHSKGPTGLLLTHDDGNDAGHRGRQRSAAFCPGNRREQSRVGQVGVLYSRHGIGNAGSQCASFSRRGAGVWNPGGPRRGTPLHRVLVGLGDQAVIEQIRRRLRAPEIVVRTIRVAGVSRDLDLMWNEPSPAEQGRLELTTTGRWKLSANRGRFGPKSLK
jgi:hypothetical protein